MNLLSPVPEHNTPKGNFGDPSSFVGNTPIATLDIRFQSVLNAQPPDLNEGTLALTADLTQQSQNIFILDGKERQFGKTGLTERLSFTGSGTRTQANPPISSIQGGGNVIITGP